MLSKKEEKLVKKIQNYWKDINNPGSFAGPRILKEELDKKLKKNIPIELVKEALLRIPEYSVTMTKRETKKFRHYQPVAVNDTAEVDLGFITPPYGIYIGFICFVDIMSRKLYAQPIRNKSKKELEKQFTKLLSRAGSYNVISSDGELAFMSEYFKKRSMYLRCKQVGKKAAICENYIRQVKRKIFLYRNINKKKNWSKIIQKICTSINKIPKVT